MGTVHEGTKKYAIDQLRDGQSGNAVRSALHSHLAAWIQVLDGLGDGIICGNVSVHEMVSHVRSVSRPGLTPYLGIDLIDSREISQVSDVDVHLDKVCQISTDGFERLFDILDALTSTCLDSARHQFIRRVRRKLSGDVDEPACHCDMRQDVREVSETGRVGFLRK